MVTRATRALAKFEQINPLCRPPNQESWMAEDARLAEDLQTTIQFIMENTL